MYLGRKLILLFVLILSLGAIIQVSSYSYARVSSPVTIAISSSENSLIAVDDTIKFDLIKEVTTVKTITAQGTKRKTTTGINKDEYSFFITNNLNETIKVRVEVFDKSVDGRADLPIAVTGGAREGMFIAPGEKKKVMLEIAEAIESGDYEVTVYAEWKNGSAEIHKTDAYEKGLVKVS